MIETTTSLRLPDSPTFLEEINLPPDLIASITGTTIAVRVLPEEQAMTRRIDVNDVGKDSSPVLIDRDGICWNDYYPVRVVFTDDQGTEWRLPRYWLNETPNSPPSLPVTQEILVAETLNLATEWDMTDVNIPWLAASRAGSRISSVEIRVSPGDPVKVSWRDPDGKLWRIPHDWRRRRIMLPNSEVLVSQGVPDDIADECDRKIVSVNYHTGSLCCLPEHFRFRDGNGGKWPVRISDCTVVGFGNGPEFQA